MPAYRAALEKASGRKSEAAPMPEDDADEGYSSAKEDVAREAATALGLDPTTIDATAFCNALKKLIALE